MSRPGRVLVVTGTSTGVGKTVVTAALSSVLAARGEQVVVVKPVQTGIADGDCDAEEVHRLTGCAVQEHADRLKVHTEFHDTVVVEGAGGLLVRLDSDGGTLLDLAAWLVDRDVDVEVVVVCAAGLGTLNHTELTVGALQARGIPVRGLVIGSWPDSPGLAETCNREDLPRVTGVPLLGAVPAGAGALGREEFTAEAGGWLPGW